MDYHVLELILVLNLILEFCDLLVGWYTHRLLYIFVYFFGQTDTLSPLHIRLNQRLLDLLRQTIGFLVNRATIIEGLILGNILKHLQLTVLSSRIVLHHHFKLTHQIIRV